MMLVRGSGFASRVKLDDVAVKFDGLDDSFVDLVEDTDDGKVETSSSEINSVFFPVNASAVARLDDCVTTDGLRDPVAALPSETGVCLASELRS